MPNAETASPSPGASAEPEVPDVGEIYLGMTQMRIGDANPDAPDSNVWQSFGLDLDGVCTNSTTCPEQQNVSCRASSQQLPFDGEECRDNSFASVLAIASQVPEVGQRFGLSEVAFNCGLWRGSYNVLVRITGYNGMPDDSNVRVDWYTSSGLEKSPGWACPTDKFDDNYQTYPRWRASASWRVDERELAGSVPQPGQLPPSRVADPNAYVRAGYLVSRLPDGATMRLAGDGQPFRGLSLAVHEALWIGYLSKAQDSTWQMTDGLAAGRMRTDGVLQSFRQVGFCRGAGVNTFFDSLATYVEENADVLASGRVEPDAPCDAMSFGFMFQASQITPGTPGPLEPLIECCAPGRTTEQCQAACGDGRVSGDERCDTAIAVGSPGACPTECAKPSGCKAEAMKGEGCDAHCVEAPVIEVIRGDGCCPEGADALRDSDCASSCGNEVLEAGETCDPPSSCPVCRSANACLRAVPSGSMEACTAGCTFTAITECARGDGCCPSGCVATTDADCSARCGDGAVQSSAGETCELTGPSPCPRDCDDGDSCTTDIITGSPTNCNMACTHVKITTLQRGDNCCPGGANASTDDDCQPVCGNGFLDSGEQCDDAGVVDGDGCDSRCQAETALQACLVAVGFNDACSNCVCTKCASEAAECYGGPNPEEIQLCGNMVNCARQYKCEGPACYCGPDLFLCAFGNPTGPCRQQIEAAAGSTALATISARSSDLSYPLGRAGVLGSCTWDGCATECGF